MAAKKSSSNTPKKDVMYTRGEQAPSEHIVPEVCHINRGIAGRSVAADMNLRAGHNRHDYDAQRPSDRLPTEHAEIIQACQSVYRKIGMVRNIIDLMTDFASEGLELQHTVKSQEQFYRVWAEKADLPGRLHDFMKLLMRDGNVIVRRKNALIARPLIKEMTRGGIGVVDTITETNVTEQPEKIGKTKLKTKKNEIPWKYTFLSPVVIKKIGGEVGRFFGSDALGMEIPPSLANSINSPKGNAEKD